jgi:hypothetical protein
MFARLAHFYLIITLNFLPGQRAKEPPLISFARGSYVNLVKPAQPAANFADQSFNPVKGLRVVRTVSFTNEYSYYARSSLVFDDTYAYISTPDGLYRTTKTLNPANPLQPIGFPTGRIVNLYFHNNTLYVLRAPGYITSCPSTDHSFLRSSDHGNSFIALDNGLSWQFGDHCTFLLPTVARFVDSLIFLNAGSGKNLLVTKDQGASWFALSGSIEPQFCSEPAFELIDNRIVLGGECPLDFAYILGGTLQPDLLSWAPQGELKPVSTPALDNRNIQFIERRGDSSMVFAGCEGCLLKSTDEGRSFRFALKYPLPVDDQKFPYVQHILFPASHPDLFVAGGFDKGITQAGYLAYSIDHGESWVDFSSFAGPPELASSNVSFVKEDPSGRILVGLVNAAAHTLTIAEVIVDMPSAPILMSEIGSEDGLVLDSVLLTRGPFPSMTNYLLTPNQSTRITLFARIADMQPGELPVVTAQFQDSHQTAFELPVEFVGTVRDFEWLTQVVVKLPTGSAAGEAQLWINARGYSSNKIAVTIK